MDNFVNSIALGNSPVISQENELEVWKTIQKLVREQRDSFDTSAEYDFRLLKRDVNENLLTNNERNCIRLRQDEKITLDILNSASILFTEMLSMPPKNSLKLVESLPKFIREQIYLTETILPLIKSK